MPALRRIMAILGALMALMGLLWIGQGRGIVTWPASSFMIGQQQWVNYGSALAVAGLLLLLLARRLPRR
ncbi:hypothetical protein [Sphingomonas rubra]|uniref:Uncharacterized protein n=1 Tax=Sphingomonas rubra TaxID=634430 RepID=A0A1I5S181_9SPHN|nr:hypothetical protein [Sphingomonas rubra]SFP64397.1 hypothetical protein SAMN04488241_104277 [Sphingomonas rubra]